MARKRTLVRSLSLARAVAAGLGAAVAGVSTPYAAIIDEATGRLAPYVTFTRSSTATYFDATGVMRTAAANQPRYDHDPVTGALRGLLVEEQRTNLLLRSQEFDNASWIKNGSSITANAAVAPDGTASGDLITSAASAGVSYVQCTVTLAASTYTASFFVKAAGSSYCAVRVQDGSTNPEVRFYLQDGSASVSQGSPVAYGAVPVGNGWWRCWVTTAAAATTGWAGVYVYSATGSRAYTAAGESLLVWGAQLEAGSFATSYIPTTSAAVSRAADVLSAPLSSIGWNAAESTLFAEYIVPWTSAGATRGVAGVDSTGRFIYFTAGSGLIPAMFDGTNTASTSAILVNVNSKTASAFSSGGQAMCSNGGAVSSTPFDGSFGAAPTALRIGESGQGSSTQLCGHIRRLRYYPRRLSDAQLQALTA